MKPLAPRTLFDSLPLDPDLFALTYDAGNALALTRLKKLLVSIVQWLGYERIYLAHNASKTKTRNRLKPVRVPKECSVF